MFFKESSLLIFFLIITLICNYSQPLWVRCISQYFCLFYTGIVPTIAKLILWCINPFVQLSDFVDQGSVICGFGTPCGIFIPLLQLRLKPVFWFLAVQQSSVSPQGRSWNCARGLKRHGNFPGHKRAHLTWAETSRVARQATLDGRYDSVPEHAEGHNMIYSELLQSLHCKHHFKNNSAISEGK